MFSERVSTAATAYRDLSRFGLPLVTPDDPRFPSLVNDVRSRAFGPFSEAGIQHAAVLLNDSGKAIIALAVIWKFTQGGGHTRTSMLANLGSSVQMDVLAGRAGVRRDRFSFILPGSKRLITQRAILGDNSDVLPQETGRAGGCVMSGGGGIPDEPDADLQRIELQLDTVFLEDGLCVGPDESGLFDSVTSDLEMQRNTARELAAALHSGATAGELFERLRTLAQHPRSSSTGSGEMRHHHLQRMFARMAIDRLVNQADEELLAWFDSVSAPPRLRLRRAAEEG